jgi:hypothetical protein
MIRPGLLLAGPGATLFRGTMVKLFVLAAACVAAAGLAPHAARAAVAGQCGLPDSSTLWFDYAEGSVPFRNDVFGHPGVITATSGTAGPAALRKRGAQTVYWEMKLGRLVGTTTAPADPATIQAAAAKLYDKAVATTGCATPLIGINELNGAGLTTPWAPPNAQYRANVLALLQALAARGVRPFLLLSAAAYTDGEARDWWLQVAQVSDLVREVYFNGRLLYKQGPVLASRRMRIAFRGGVSNLTSIGIPVSRLGLVIGFQSGIGFGGREGLQPTSAWLDFAKLQTLAAKQVASELGITSVWSWGWGTFSPAGADADKPAAACVYLWARDPTLCNGPAAAGAGFDDSRTKGQIALPPGVQCALDGRPVTKAGVQRLTTLTGDGDLALTALFERVAESRRLPLPAGQVAALERTVTASRFHGSRSAYVAALRAQHVSTAVARGILGDGLRRAAIESSLDVAVTPSQISLFYDAFPDLLVRLVQSDSTPLWLGGRRRGYALSPPAPPEVVSAPLGRRTSIVGAGGVIRVTPLEQPLPLGALPISLAVSAIRAALAGYARAAAFDAWTLKVQASALDRITCLRDDLPSVGSVDLSSYLPFLAVDP